MGGHFPELKKDKRWCEEDTRHDRASPPSCLACSCLAGGAALPSPPPGQALPALTQGSPLTPQETSRAGHQESPLALWQLVVAQAGEGREDSAHSALLAGRISDRVEH